MPLQLERDAGPGIAGGGDEFGGAPSSRAASSPRPLRANAAASSATVR